MEVRLNLITFDRVPSFYLQGKIKDFRVDLIKRYL